MSWQNFLSILLLTLFAAVRIDSHRILAIFPTPSISHQVVFRPVIQKLAARGHHVTLLTPDPFGPHENITIINLNFLYEDWKEMDFVQIAELNPFDMVHILVTKMYEMMQKIMELDQVQPILRKEKEFDVVICEFLGYTPMYAFAHLYQVPLIGMTSLDMSPSEHSSIGNVIHSVLHPHTAFPFFGDLTFGERIQAVYMSLIMKYYFVPTFGGKFDELIYKYFGRDFPNSYDMTRKASLAINNAHPALGFTRPIVPTTIQVGLLHVKEPKPLPTDLEVIMETSERGVIYFSLGSNVKSANLKKDQFETFLKVFARLPYDIIWKFENETMYGKPKNVVIRKWLPQQDLLAHPNLKLFITHGGQQSMEEAVDRAVPLLCIPFFGDQEMNSKKIEHLGIGRRLLLNNLSPKTFEASIQEVINNKKYKEAILELRDVVKDTPLSGVDTATWWIEYTIRHNGTRHLRYQGLNFPHWKYYYLDVAAFTIAVLLVVVGVLYFIVRLFSVFCKLKEGKVKVH
ncbi:UDP-glycosyltransferase UGT5-like [Culicoides brevitarsis]|uniref:UDP-glycosyltransferase UGT5-like n=1 Tax=Culicoides brevitarsis TaxID=469753 RepID=UPI00307BE61E